MQITEQERNFMLAILEQRTEQSAKKAMEYLKAGQVESLYKKRLCDGKELAVIGIISVMHRIYINRQRNVAV